MRFKQLVKLITPSFVRAPKSTIEALAKLVPINILENIVIGTADRRCIAQEVASYLGQTEHDLMLNVARVMGVGYIAKPEVIPSSVSCNIEVFRKAAAIPLYQQGMLLGVICVDPELYRAVMRIESLSNFYLGSWSEISNALYNSEKLCYQVSETVKTKSVDSIDCAVDASEATKLVEKVLKFIKSEACKHSASELILFKTSEEFLYRFKTCTGQYASGSIDLNLWSLVLEALFSKAEFLLSIWSIDELLVVKSITEDQVSLAWQAQPLELEHTIRTSSEPKLAIVKNPIEVSRNFQFESTSLQDTCILIVEDNQTFAVVLERFLDRHGCIVRHAESGAVAIDLLDSHDFQADLIVCDLHMPKVNGYELIKLIRKNIEYIEIPIIVLTSDYDLETELAVLGIGADAFIAKNEDPRILEAQVKNLISKSKRSRAIKEAA